MLRRWFRATLPTAALSCLILTSLASAAEYALDAKDITQQCSGMYSKKAWGGSKDPSITIKFPKSENDADTVSLVIFEYEDEQELGIYPDAEKLDEFDRRFICKPDDVSKGLCKTEGEFILASNPNGTSYKSIHTEAIQLSKEHPIRYEIKKTGYYCVWAVPYRPPTLEYDAVVVFQNSYGELPGSQIAKLPFYGGMTIVYVLIAALWAFLYVQHRRDILPVQNYITAIIIFLILEMLMTWAFYDYQNRHGSNAVAKVLMIIVSILNAGRNSFSFFLLLIVCMGYGVVKPSLGGLMKWARILAGTHFIFGVGYAIASLTITPDNAGPIVLFVILPLAATLTAFYVWTLNSLKLTMKELEERKQHTKGLMYRRLWWVLLTSILVIFAFFFLNSLTFAGHGDPDFAPTHWKTRWFVLDGWLNLVYLFILISIAYIWRPTENNRRFAMSDELAQDEDGGFEFASVGGSELDEDSDDEERKDKDLERGRSGNGASSSSGGGVATFAATGGIVAGAGAGAGAAAAQGRHRASVDEPIFEVGDEDGAWSSPEEDNDDDDDRRPGSGSGGEGESLVKTKKKD